MDSKRRKQNDNKAALKINVCINHQKRKQVITGLLHIIVLTALIYIDIKIF